MLRDCINQMNCSHCNTFIASKEESICDSCNPKLFSCFPCEYPGNTIAVKDALVSLSQQENITCSVVSIQACRFGKACDKPVCWYSHY